jgi:cytochrome bd-type quinol oxidase subunit 2
VGALAPFGCRRYALTFEMKNSKKTDLKNQRLLKIALLVSLGLYLFGVALSMILLPDKGGFNWEGIYGPALTIISCWVLFGITYFLTCEWRKKNNCENRKK